ncbi:MAG: hypothetical protein J5829_05990 [Lachnospiraceae bacterium]|nr:hypothetical protein [Lachnospiraceae bacterium]
MYFVTQAYDMPWFNDYLGIPVADHFEQISEALPDYVRREHLTYQDPDDYMNIHYKTDHHWNHRGSRRGYEDIYSMMSRDFDMGDMLVPKKENRASGTYDFVYLGSYGRALGELYEGYDEFSFYEYDLPDRELAVIDPDSLDEMKVSEMGLYDEYEKGKINREIGTDHYIVLYGTSCDTDGNEYGDNEYPFIIRNREGNGKNLLITGDSYDRAMRDELAAHFDTTVYLDRRIYSKIPIDFIIEKYDIDALLLSSQKSLWGSEDYPFTFRGEE